MNRILIYEYINRLEKEDIINYCNKKNIFINDNELDTIYSYIKNDYQRFFNNPDEVLNEIKDRVSMYTYGELMKLYNKYKRLIYK